MSSPHPPPFLPPHAVIAGRYQVERVLGVGGMGVVYLATHLVLEERVALKFMQSRYEHMPEASARFVREGRSQFRICSDNVVRVLDVGVAESGAPFIAMEYVEGVPLNHLLERGPVDMATACEIVRQVCSGIASAHALGIVHRDVKPSNVLVTMHAGIMRAKVLDFGIAQLVEAAQVDATRLTSTTMVLGTLSYVAPEQLRASRLADARSDMWSIGAVLYELLTGRLPYEAESPADMILRQLEGPPPSASTVRSSVPPALSELAARCLVFEPHERHITAAQLAEALAPFARDDGMLASMMLPGCAPPPAPPHMGLPLTFRRRKVRDSSGGTAFVMHEPVAPNATALLSDAPRALSRPHVAEQIPGSSPGIPPMALLVALVGVAVTVVLALTIMMSSTSGVRRTARHVDVPPSASLGTMRPGEARSATSTAVVDEPAAWTALAPEAGGAPPLSVDPQPPRSPKQGAAGGRARDLAPGLSPSASPRAPADYLDLRR